MWVVWLLSLFAFGQTQILTATGAVSWENSGNWDLGSIPLGLFAVVINTSAQVTFDTTLTTALPSLTLGSASAVDTAIIITGQRDLLVTNFEWIRGDIRMNNTGVFILNGAAHVSSGADSSIVGGEFRIPLISAGSVSIDASTKLECKGCKLNSHGKMWTLGTNAILNFTGSAELTSDIVFAGTGTWHVEAGATLAVATGVAVTVGNGVNGSISGLLQLASSASSSIVVASSGWLSLNGGGSVSGGTIDVDGQLTIPSGAAAFTVTTASVTVAGSGNVSVSGRLDVDAALTVSENAHLWVKSGGDFRIKGGVAVTLKNASFDANSDWHLNFPDNNATFAKVTVSGALQLGGRVHLYVSVKPTARVVLVTAASISGSITADVTVGAGAGRRLLGNGQVLVTNTTIEYDPEGGSEASAATSMYCLSGLATTMLFAMI